MNPDATPAVHCYDTEWQLGMPHTAARAMSEVALLAHAQDLSWKEIARLTGCPASRQLDAEGHEVYASVFFVDLDAPTGLSVFGPDDCVHVRGTLGRYGASILDACHELAPAGVASAASSIRLRMSFVLVALGSGPDDLRVATPVNAPVDRIPALEREPDSYRIVRAARAAGTLLSPAIESTPLWREPFSRVYPINPDRDLNGVGLLYFANYVAFLDAAERDALREAAGLSPTQLDGRVTVLRRIAYYGNARSSDRLQITVEAHALDGLATGRLRVQHRVHRESDGRLIALASAERRLAPVS